MAERRESVELVPDVTVERVAQAVLIAALTAVLAQASIDLPGGIPFSFQPFAVFFAGLLLGPVWGGFAMVLYLVVGLAGAPVFSNLGAGVGYFLGPTGGFLVGFVGAAIVIGAVTHRGSEPRDIGGLSVLVVVLALLASFVPTYGVGLPWFAEVTGMGYESAASFFAPFVAGDLIKVAITVAVVRGGSEILSQVE